MHDEISQVYYAKYVLIIECWATDSRDVEPKLNDRDWNKSWLSRAMKSRLLLSSPPKIIPLPKGEFSTRRGLQWLEEMPLIAIKFAELHGNVTFSAIDDVRVRLQQQKDILEW